MNEAAAGDTAEGFAASWRARGLIDYDYDSRRVLTYQRVRQIQESQMVAGQPIHAIKTDLYSRLPQTAQLIEEISRRPIKSRLFLLKAGSALPWHSHYGGGFSRTQYRHCVVQIPLVNSMDCVYEVRNKANGAITAQRYEPGEIWVFNCFHDHRVVNRSSQDRISLFIETDLSDLQDALRIRELTEAFRAS